MLYTAGITVVHLPWASMPYRLAIVEDNATARANLRSHLLRLGDFEVSSFSSGQELKAALRRQHFELVVFDYYLGASKTGVEWLQHLRRSKFIRPSTGIVFLTSDRVAQTIGQIIDCQPDLLLIKPYNLQTLSRGLNQYLAYRQYAEPALQAMDEDNPARALALLEHRLQGEVPARIRNDLYKLKAQLLFDAGHIVQARALYEAILIDCDKVLWAQWGRIKCFYREGNWAGCKGDLDALIGSELAREKAFEWLASLSFEQEAYQQAEYYLDQISPSALSVPATRLKSLTYQRQQRPLEGIELLQKQRNANRDATDRFNELTVELAEFYLAIAEQQPLTNREESLSQARRLLGIAGRHTSDAQASQKRTLLMAYTALLEDAPQRARNLMKDTAPEHFGRTDAGTLITGAKVFQGLGLGEQARQLLSQAHSRNRSTLSLAEQIFHQASLTHTEHQLGLASEQAFELNNQGTALFVKKRYLDALYYFYQAYKLLPNTPALGLNLLHCLLEAGHSGYRSLSVGQLLNALQSLPHTDSGRQRLAQLRRQVRQQQTNGRTKPAAAGSTD